MISDIIDLGFIFCITKTWQFNRRVETFCVDVVDFSFSTSPFQETLAMHVSRAHVWVLSVPEDVGDTFEIKRI